MSRKNIYGLFFVLCLGLSSLALGGNGGGVIGRIVNSGFAGKVALNHILVNVRSVCVEGENLRTIRKINLCKSYQDDDGVAICNGPFGYLSGPIATAQPICTGITELGSDASICSRIAYGPASLMQPVQVQVAPGTYEGDPATYTTVNYQIPSCK